MCVPSAAANSNLSDLSWANSDLSDLSGSKRTTKEKPLSFSEISLTGLKSFNSAHQSSQITSKSPNKDGNRDARASDIESFNSSKTAPLSRSSALKPSKVSSARTHLEELGGEMGRNTSLFRHLEKESNRIDGIEETVDALVSQKLADHEHMACYAGKVDSMLRSIKGQVSQLTTDNAALKQEIETIKEVVSDSRSRDSCGPALGIRNTEHFGISGHCFWGILIVSTDYQCIGGVTIKLPPKTVYIIS